MHAGNNIFIANDAVLGIFDLDTSTVNRATRDFLRGCEQAGRVSAVNEELPKSFILHDGGCTGGEVLLCPLNTAVLRARCARLYEGL